MNFNPRMRFVWIAQAFLVVQLLFLWALFIYVMLPLDNDLIDGIPNRILILGSVLGFSVLLLIGVAIGAEIYYRTFEYEFKENEFVVRKGIINKKEISFPYKEIKSAKVLRNGVHVLDQVFGLTCISVKSGSQAALIPGIAEPEVFLRRLMAHVEGNEKIQNSEIYMSEREILIKLAADVRALHEKVESVIAEQKSHKELLETHRQESQQRHTGIDEFKMVEKDIDKLLNMKSYKGLSDSQSSKGRKRK